MDPTDPAGPVVVHAFLPRTAAGVDVVATWDAQGMRATESHDTVFDGAWSPTLMSSLWSPPARLTTPRSA